MRLTRWVAVTGLSAVVLGGVGCTAFFAHSPPAWVPPGARGAAADLRLGLAPLAKKVLSVGRISVPHLRFYRDGPTRDVRFPSGSLSLAATLYHPDRGPAPAVLLLHASTAEGRRLGLYRLLGRELTRRGYVVLVLDQRGFGDSDDPPRADSPEAFDVVADARNALAYLRGLEGVDRERVSIVGHSYGASIALAAALEEPAVRAVVAIGPTRRFHQRMRTELDYARRRAKHIMKLSQPIPRDVYLAFRERINIERLQPAYAGPGHPPVMLVDGSLEPEADRRHLRAMYQSFSEPKRFLRLRNGDHYANSANLGATVVYDAAALGELMAGIEGWLGTHAGGVE
ncbi:MAG: alpha/beta hydrolase [Gemmatimonadaceae bacterium]